MNRAIKLPHTPTCTPSADRRRATVRIDKKLAARRRQFPNYNLAFLDGTVPPQSTWREAPQSLIQKTRGGDKQPATTTAAVNVTNLI